MPQTANSSAASYCSPAQAIQFFDAAFQGLLVNDDGNAATSADLLNPATAAGATFKSILEAASGQLESACTKGQRYQPTDLASLTGVSVKLLQRIVACLAIGDLIWRRNPKEAPPPVLEWAEKQLAALEAGSRVFGLVETQAAGIGAVSTSNLTAGQEDRDTITGRAERMFGERAWEF